MIAYYSTEIITNIKRLIVNALILAFCLVKGQCHKHLTGKIMIAPK